jgi:hypothetical protein
MCWFLYVAELAVKEVDTASIPVLDPIPRPAESIGEIAEFRWLGFVGGHSGP